MAENKMKEVAKLLGVEMGVPFKIKGYIYNPCELTENTFVNSLGNTIYNRLFQLLIGKLEIEQPILTQKEKTYLEGVLRPFKDSVLHIEKSQNTWGQLIYIEIKEDWFGLPYFEKDAMYKGMELNRRYTLEELGLFQD